MCIRDSTHTHTHTHTARGAATISFLLEKVLQIAYKYKNLKRRKLLFAVLFAVTLYKITSFFPEKISSGIPNEDNSGNQEEIHKKSFICSICAHMWFKNLDPEEIRNELLWTFRD